MKRILTAIAAFGLCAAALPLSAAPASEASVEKLLKLTQVDQSADRTVAQVTNMLGGQIRQMLKGQELSADDEAAIQAATDKLKESLKTQLTWEKLKPGFVQAYTQEFTQEQIDGIIAFYESPAGKAFADKAPELTQKTQALVHEQLMPVIMAAQGSLQDTLRQIAANHQKAAPKEAPQAAVTGPVHTKGDTPIHISQGAEIDLKNYLVPGKTTVFDFYSVYCPPCMALSPFLEKLHKGRDDVAVVKVDVNRAGVKGIDWDSPVIHQFKIESIPHLKVFNPDGTLKVEGDDARELVQGWIDALPKS